MEQSGKLVDMDVLLNKETRTAEKESKSLPKAEHQDTVVVGTVVQTGVLMTNMALKGFGTLFGVSNMDAATRSRSASFSDLSDEEDVYQAAINRLVSQDGVSETVNQYSDVSTCQSPWKVTNNP